MTPDLRGFPGPPMGHPMPLQSPSAVSSNPEPQDVCLVAHLCLTLCNPADCSLPVSFVHADSPGKNTRVGCHALFQGIFPTQESSWGLPHCRWILYQLSQRGAPGEQPQWEAPAKDATLK